MSLRIFGAELTIGKETQCSIVQIPELDLGLGTCTALAGRSGSGKTSVLELAALMRIPSSLSGFRVADKDVRQLSLTGSLDARASFRSSNISFTVQSGGFLPFLSGEENALAGVRVLGHPVNAMVKERLIMIARELQVLDALAKRRSELSGGERYRIGLIRSLLEPRQLVLVDEPTAALDDTLAKIVLRLLRELADSRGATVLIATHDVELAQDAGFAIQKLLPTGIGFRVSALGNGVCREH